MRIDFVKSIFGYARLNYFGHFKGWFQTGLKAMNLLVGACKQRSIQVLCHTDYMYRHNSKYALQASSPEKKPCNAPQTCLVCEVGFGASLWPLITLPGLPQRGAVGRRRAHTPPTGRAGGPAPPSPPAALLNLITAFCTPCVQILTLTFSREP